MGIPPYQAGSQRCVRKSLSRQAGLLTPIPLTFLLTHCFTMPLTFTFAAHIGRMELAPAILNFGSGRCALGRVCCLFVCLFLFDFTEVAP